MQSVAVLPSHAPHGSKARLIVVPNRRDSWRSHVHRTRFGKHCSSSSYRPAMSGIEGEGPSSLSLGGCKGAVLFPRKENSPLLRTPAPRGRLFHVLLKRDHTQMLEQDLESDQNENDAAGELGAALVARAEHIADVHPRNRDHKRRAADDRDGRHNIHL